VNKLTIGYFADGPWAHQAFEKLIADPTVCIAFVCARHDLPDPVLKLQAEKFHIRFLTHANINSETFIEDIRAHECDLFISMSFNQIFRKKLFEYPKWKTINCHAGKLPFYRGRNILNWALINDEKEFGITVHYVDEGIDTGDIISQRTLPITDQDDYAALLKRAHSGCAELLYESVKQLQSGNAQRIKQSTIHNHGFYCTARRPGDERLSWNQSSREIFNFVRAICKPGPQARTFLNDSEIKINRVELMQDAPAYKGVIGAVIGVATDGFVVKTADSYIRVVDWEAKERVKMGDRLE